MSGGVLLSHRVSPAVPSALRVLASGFGMCPGVSLALWPPKLWYQHQPVWGGVVVSVPPCVPRPALGAGWGGGVAVLCCVGFPSVGNHRVDASNPLGHTPLPYNDGVCGDCQVIGVLVPVSCTSLSSLLPHPAYQPSRLLGASPPKGWKSHLEAGFPLRCFQRLSIPNVANQRCSWRNNWHTRGSSNPVLSY